MIQLITGRENERAGCYGKCPISLGFLDMVIPEVMCYLYLPVKMKGSMRYKLPANLRWVRPMLDMVECDKDDYVYVTVKNLFEHEGTHGNRAGWHSDGFMTDDVSYLWCNGQGTEFAIEPDFPIVPMCHEKSKAVFEDYMQGRRVHTAQPKHVMYMDEKVIHRTPMIEESGFRQFVKISVSKNKYDLKGNSHNYLFNYDWDMHDREEVRNCPSTAEKNHG